MDPFYLLPCPTPSSSERGGGGEGVGAASPALRFLVLGTLVPGSRKWGKSKIPSRCSCGVREYIDDFSNKMNAFNFVLLIPGSQLC